MAEDPILELGENERLFMQRAFTLAEEALAVGEVPVGCVFVRDGVIIAEGRNEVNATRNATRHAELVAFDRLIAARGVAGTLDDSLIAVHRGAASQCSIANANACSDNSLGAVNDVKVMPSDQSSLGNVVAASHDQLHDNEAIKKSRNAKIDDHGILLTSCDHSNNAALDSSLEKLCACSNDFTFSRHASSQTNGPFVVYVTVEPCIMCADALRQLGVKCIRFGCANERFGGLGSVKNVYGDFGSENTEIVGGIEKHRAIALLQRFYAGENPNCPQPKLKMGRKEKLSLLEGQDRH